MVTAYNFADDDHNTDLGDIGKQLTQTGKSKDNLIKLLKVNSSIARRDLMQHAI